MGKKKLQKGREQAAPSTSISTKKRVHDKGPISEGALKKTLKKEEAEELAGKRAVAWLQGSLRVRDNAILRKAAEAGPGGLDVVVVWRHGERMPTPAASFMASAMRSLNDELGKLGNGLQVLYATENSDQSAAAAVAAHAVRVAASTVLVDCSEEAGEDAAAFVQGAISTHSHASSVVTKVHALHDDTLFTHAQALTLLSESTAGDKSKVLKWTGFLKAASSLPEPPQPHPAPARLPPPCTAVSKTLDIPADSPWWGVPTHDGWLKVTGVPISEIGGLQLAKMAGEGQKSNGRPGFSAKHLGQRAGAGDDADGRAAPRPAYVSPYLRWGVISARQANDLGVRRRDLLWRDFSRLCWRSTAPLRKGEPVTQSLPVDDVETFDPDYAIDATLATVKGAVSAWNWAPRLEAPEAGSEGAAQLQILHQKKHTSADAGAATKAAEWKEILGLTDGEVFEAWCAGRTGAPLVDAGMIQLWACGWMPRRVRLLCASCLVEGLGLDWRLGRDWFAYALTDHDYAINECMWQNAGLVGIDPFYRGLRWEVVPTDAEQDDDVATGKGARKGKSTLEERSGYVSSNSYTRKWLDLPPSDLPPWPPPLHAARARAAPAIEAVAHVAEQRRFFLKRAYQSGGRVSRVGIRIPTPTQPPFSSDIHPITSAVALRTTLTIPPDAVARRYGVGHMQMRVPPICMQDGGPKYERDAQAACGSRIIA